MPLQNRVTPQGELVVAAERGLFMGNRGRLHDEHRRVRRWADGRRWIICVLEFRGRRRQVMAPGRYTELFFLDEATALAAGHRPCYECRRADYLRFVAAWPGDAATEGGGRLLADDLDRALDRERRRGRERRTFDARPEDLPDGTMVEVPTEFPVEVPVAGVAVATALGGTLRTWGHAGYGPPTPPPRRAVRVLTPPSTVEALRAGYRPVLHPTAEHH